VSNPNRKRTVVPLTRIADLSLKDFMALYPRIAGADPSLAEMLANLETEVKGLGTQEQEDGSDGGGTATVTETETETPEARQKRLDDRETELKGIETGLIAQATSLQATAAQIKAHGGSRFVGDGADGAVAEHIANGGSVKNGGLILAGNGLEDASAGAHRGAKELKDSKQFVRFFSAMDALRKGHASDAQREFMMESKALAEGTGSAGGYMIPPDWMPEILPLFRGVTVVRRANPRIVPFSAQMNQVQLSTGATAYYTPENAAITPSQETFAQVTLLTPKNLTGLVPVSTYLLNDTSRRDVPNPITADAEDVIRQDLATVMALKEDKSFLMGNPGTETGAPTGITNISGIVTNPITPPTNGFQPTLPQLRAIRNYVRRFSVPNPRWTWFFNPMFLSYVEQLTDSLGRFLADTSLLKINDGVTDASTSGSVTGQGVGLTGVLDGVPFLCSTQIPTNLSYGSANNATWLLLVDMNQLVVGLNQDMVVEVSTDASYTPDGGTTWISSFQNNQTLFKTVLRHDINHLYPYTILQQEGVLVS
jgi:HK97 family phage major capsid protein